MCGLVGVFGDISQKEKVAFKWLLHFDTVRGEHSTGVAAVSEKNETSIYKELGVPSQLFQTFEEIFPKGHYKNSAKLLMGHNRFATQGKIVAENAHPFEFENIIGAHNGTVSSFLTDGMFGAKDFELDSQRIYSQLNHDANAQNLWAMLEDAQYSAASLTYWDKRDCSMNFLRNNQRPMYTCLTKTGNTLLYASEKWMLAVAAAQAGLSINEPESTAANTAYKISYREGKFFLDKKEVEAKKFVYVPQKISYGNFTGKCPAKYVDLRIDYLVEDVAHPHVVLTKMDGATEVTVLCIPPEPEKEKLFQAVSNYFNLHKEVYEGDVLLKIDESWIYTGADNHLRVGAYRLMKDLADETTLIEYEIKNGEEELPPFSVCKGVDGSPLQGKWLKIALEAAGCTCTMCGQTDLKKGDILKVHGGVFLRDKTFVCGECVSDGLLHHSYTYVN